MNKKLQNIRMPKVEWILKAEDKSKHLKGRSAPRVGHGTVFQSFPNLVDGPPLTISDKCQTQVLEM